MNIKRRGALFICNHFCAGTRFFALKRILLRIAGYQIGQGTKVVGPVFCTGKLTVGEHCWVGRDLKIYGNGEVIIGNSCDLGPEVTFLTGGHAIGDAGRRAGRGESYCIRVEDGCWLGAKTTLLGSITMGMGSVLAACGCAVRDIPPNTLAAGVPAKEIRRLHEA